MKLLENFKKFVFCIAVMPVMSGLLFDANAALYSSIGSGIGNYRSDALAQKDVALDGYNFFISTGYVFNPYFFSGLELDRFKVFQTKEYQSTNYKIYTKDTALSLVANGGYGILFFKLGYSLHNLKTYMTDTSEEKNIVGGDVATYFGADNQRRYAHGPLWGIALKIEASAAIALLMDYNQYYMFGKDSKLRFFKVGIKFTF